MRTCLVIVISLILNSVANAQQQEAASIPILVKSANALIQSLSSKQKSETLLPFESGERVDWHYIPKERKGVSMKDLSAGQREVAMALLGNILSQEGYRKLNGVIQSETILWLLSNKSDHRDPENYHLTIFGMPGNHTTWGVSFEGHHLSINLTIIDGKEVYVTPSFMGSNPETSESGHQPLAGELDSAKTLFESLDKAQQSQATLNGTMPREILTRASPKVSPVADEGLPASRMNELQKALLRKVIAEYVDRYRKPFAEDDWNKIETAGFDKVTFVWSSDSPQSRATYYRVQGPTFVIEYANSQNHGNHSHTVWRDFDNDFGYDALRSHMNRGN